MSEQQLTEEQVAARRTPGQWLFFSGIGMLLFGLYISAFLVPDVIRTAAGPQSVTLTEAADVAHAEQTYVRIEDGTWDCDTLVAVRGLSPSQQRYTRLREVTKFTEIFFTDETRDVVVFVTLSGAVNCDALAAEVPAGYLYAMSDNLRQELTNDARLARYFTTETFLELCGYCGRDNSLIGAVFGVVFTLLGVVMIIYGRKLRKRYRKPLSGCKFNPVSRKRIL